MSFPKLHGPHGAAAAARAHNACARRVTMPIAVVILSVVMAIGNTGVLASAVGTPMQRSVHRRATFPEGVEIVLWSEPGCDGEPQKVR